MDEFQRKVRKSLEAKGLLDAKGTGAIMRRMLPLLEQMAANGRSSEELRAAVAEQGVTFGDVFAFRNALYRARKAGPLIVEPEAGRSSLPELIPSGRTAQKPEPKEQKTGPVDQPGKASPEASTPQFVGESRVVAQQAGGVLVTRREQGTKVIEANPKNEDLF